LTWFFRLGEADYSVISDHQTRERSPVPVAYHFAMNHLTDYERDGVILVRSFLSAEEVAAVRAELERYIREDLASKPLNARTLEKDEKTVRNLWRLEEHNEVFHALGHREDIKALIAPLVHGEPVLCAVETFNKPARIASP
jgi:hypothetical protein